MEINKYKKSMLGKGKKIKVWSLTTPLLQNCIDFYKKNKKKKKKKIYIYIYIHIFKYTQLVVVLQ